MLENLCDELVRKLSATQLIDWRKEYPMFQGGMGHGANVVRREKLIPFLSGGWYEPGTRLAVRVLPRVWETGLFRWAPVDLIIRQHMQRKANYGYHLWGMLMLFLWIRQFKIQTGQDVYSREVFSAI